MRTIAQLKIAQFLHKMYNLYMKNIIVISGKQYSGKDTLAKILLENLTDFSRVGIGDAIKIQYAKENNLTFEEIEKNKHLYRADLIKLGNKGRAIDSDYWLNSIINMPNNIIVPDIRVEHEAELFRNNGAYLIRVEASYEIRSKRAVITNENDPTETALDNYKHWHCIVENNSDFDTLCKKAKEIVPKIKEFFN